MKYKDAKVLAFMLYRVTNPESSCAICEDWADQLTAELEDLDFIEMPEGCSREPSADKESNPIGWLQEHCQKNGFPAPQYQTEKFLSPTHSVDAFQAQVSILFDNGLQHVTGEEFSNKREAKKDAARNMIEMMRKENAS